MTANILGRENGVDLGRYQIQEKYEEFDGMARKPMSKGDVVIITGTNPSSIRSLFICCPSCGDASFTSTHKIQEVDNKLTVNPSLVFKCCGWHGYLEQGIFTNADKTPLR